MGANNEIILIAKAFLNLFKKKYKEYSVGDVVVFTYWESPWTYQKDLKRIGKIVGVSDIKNYYLIEYIDEGIAEKISAINIKNIKCKFLENNVNSSEPRDLRKVLKFVK